MRMGLLLPTAAALLTGCATSAPVTTASAPESVSPAFASGRTSAPATVGSTTVGPTTTVSATAASTPAALSTAAKPITLSRSQANAITDAFWRALDDPAWVKVGAYSAGIDPAGITIVCGAVNARNSFGVYSGMKPFRGEFRGGEFKPSVIGGPDPSVTIASCEKAGLPIKL
jgi:hypothetical protein